MQVACRVSFICARYLTTYAALYRLSFARTITTILFDGGSCEISSDYLLVFVGRFGDNLAYKASGTNKENDRCQIAIIQ